MHLDLKNKKCPIPVVETEKALNLTSFLTVEVNSKTAMQSIISMAESKQCSFDIKEDGDIYTISIQCDSSLNTKNDASAESIVIQFTSEGWGTDDMVLGKRLMSGFIDNIINMTPLPKSLIFLNASVKLVTENENTVVSLLELEAKGVEILACGTCLNYFNLADELKVGKITDAHTVMKKLWSADKIIKP
jgi:selenium metabolism protein YedF